ncbi:hypothetical protein [Streptosporangium sp. V21-05]|uniref:hypothetical protein n=1 Tax=Streptosporangium sp. V21-05 TaxID=3446115 RepID=UPI003F529358
MSTPTGTGRLTPGPGQGAAWVREHGAHLMDYAASHLESGRTHAAVVSALAAGRVEAAPGNVTARGRLLAALRRDCRTSPGYRERYVPGSGPGMPDASLIERVWTIVDPLGTETLRLTYRHALGMEDLAHVLAMPVDEVGRLATRTQDLIETLVSGLDALAHGRRTCPELAPLVETVFPGVFPAGQAAEHAASPSDPEDAQARLLSHMIRCSVCTRPINIRYTVPQMISHPPVAPLSAEEQRRLTEALPPEAATEAGSGEPARPARGGSPVLSAPPGEGRSPVLPAPPPGGRAPGHRASSSPGHRSVAPPGHRSPAAPASPAPSAAAPSTPSPSPRVGTPPYPPVASKPPAKPAASTPSSTAAAGAVSPVTAPGDGPAAGSPDPANPSGLPPLPALPPRKTRPSRPPSPPPVPGHDTPLYDALLTQAWAREVLAQSEELTGTIPRQEPPAPKPVAKAEPIVIAGQASVEMRDTEMRDTGVRETGTRDTGVRETRTRETRTRGTKARDTGTRETRKRDTGIRDDSQVPALRFHTEPDDRPDEERIEMGIRVLEALSWAGARIRNTTIKLVIIVVAGAAGTLTGMNLLGPAIESEEPASSLQASTSQATRSPPPAADAPARQDGLASRLRVPPVVTLDEFGLGSMVLTISGEPLKWRISAPGLAVSPSSGTLREGVTQVINLRAHRVRNWCGAPASVTAPMTVHGLDDSVGTTVRWRTC